MADRAFSSDRHLQGCTVAAKALPDMPHLEIELEPPYHIPGTYTNMTFQAWRM